jgi:hypothetical protein
LCKTHYVFKVKAPIGLVSGSIIFFLSVSLFQDVSESFYVPKSILLQSFFLLYGLKQSRQSAPQKDTEVWKAKTSPALVKFTFT